jgi:sugar O-acyltransferase (sialic acid O-acetyltransferase NeuD family)
MIAILGAGPHGQELGAGAARAGFTRVLFFDDDPDIPGLTGPISRYMELARGSRAGFVIGAAWPEVRRQIADKAAGQVATRLFDPDCTFMGGDLGGGVVLAAGARIGPGVSLGAHTHVNLNATISRGSIIGEMVTVCPGANIAGGVIVEDDVFIGAGAVVAHELVIGRGALIGAGAVVVEDVKPFETVMGNPARPR